MHKLIFLKRCNFVTTGIMRTVTAKAWFPCNRYDHYDRWDRCDHSEKSTQRSQRSYGNNKFSDRSDRDRWDRKFHRWVHGLHMIVAIAELIFLSDHNDHNDHSDPSDYMETRLKQLYCKAWFMRLKYESKLFKTSTCKRASRTAHVERFLHESDYYRSRTCFFRMNQD